MLSSREVLPERYGPHSATTRCAPLPGLPPVMVSVFMSAMTTPSFCASDLRTKAPEASPGRTRPGIAGRRIAPASVDGRYQLSAVTRTQDARPASPRSERNLVVEMLPPRPERVNETLGEDSCRVLWNRRR